MIRLAGSPLQKDEAHQGALFEIDATWHCGRDLGYDCLPSRLGEPIEVNRFYQTVIFMKNCTRLLARRPWSEAQAEGVVACHDGMQSVFEQPGIDRLARVERDALDAASGVLPCVRKVVVQLRSERYGPGLGFLPRFATRTGGGDNAGHRRQFCDRCSLAKLLGGNVET